MVLGNHNGAVGGDEGVRALKQAPLLGKQHHEVEKKFRSPIQSMHVGAKKACTKLHGALNSFTYLKYLKLIVYYNT